MILTGIGTGPGDKDYLTLGQVKALREADIIFAPVNKGKTRALDTVIEFIDGKKLVELDFPMGEVTKEIYKKNAEIIESYVDVFKRAVFITIGDAMVYSTFYNISTYIKNEKIKMESLPGIPSFLGAFNKCLLPLTEKGDNFLLTDGDFDEEILNKVDSIAILKTGKRKEEYLNKLEKYGFSYVYIKRLSDYDERIINDREEILKDEDYISLIIGRKER